MFSQGLVAKLRRRVWLLRLLVGAVILAIAATVFVATPSLDERKITPRDKLWRFVDDVLLGTTAPEQEEVITRWTRSPTVSLFIPAGEDARKRDEKLFRSVVREINDVLGNTGYELRYIGKNKKPSDIIFVVSSQDDFRFYAKNLSVVDEEYLASIENSLDYSTVYLNDDYSIAKAIVVVSAETPMRHRRAVMLYELLQALGFHKSSPACPLSISYRKDGQTVTGEQLAIVDREVLRFLYSQLQPGDTWVPVWEAFQGLEPKQYGCVPSPEPLSPITGVATNSRLSY